MGDTMAQMSFYLIASKLVYSRGATIGQTYPIAVGLPATVPSLRNLLERLCSGIMRSPTTRQTFKHDAVTQLPGRYQTRHVNLRWPFWLKIYPGLHDYHYNLQPMQVPGG